MGKKDGTSYLLEWLLLKKKQTTTKKQKTSIEKYAEKLELLHTVGGNEKW